MWCQQCRQDVPVRPLGEQQPPCCPRCGDRLLTAQPMESACSITPEEAAAAEYTSETETWTPNVAKTPPLYDSWEIDEQLRHLQRLLQGSKAPTTFDVGPKTVRFDTAQSIATGNHARHSEPAARRNISSRRFETASTPATPQPGLSPIQWIISAVGTACFACGGVLSMWSLATGRRELWAVGLPTLLSGQILLLLSWAVQLGRLSHANRTAAVQLDTMRRRLGKLRLFTMK